MWSKRIRSTHRWLSMTFLLTVVITAIAVATQDQPADWVLYLPLFPLAFLAFSGVYLFVLPYKTKRRGAVSAE